VTQRRQRVLNGLALRVKHGLLRHYPDVSFHKKCFKVARLEGSKVEPCTPETLQPFNREL
jgi:hypothetical protein